MPLRPPALPSDSARESRDYRSVPSQNPAGSDTQKTRGDASKQALHGADRAQTFLQLNAPQNASCETRAPLSPVKANARPASTIDNMPPSPSKSMKILTSVPAAPATPAGKQQSPRRLPSFQLPNSIKKYTSGRPSSALLDAPSLTTHSGSRSKGAATESRPPNLDAMSETRPSAPENHAADARVGPSGRAGRPSALSLWQDSRAKCQISSAVATKDAQIPSASGSPVDVGAASKLREPLSPRSPQGIGNIPEIAAGLSIQNMSPPPTPREVCPSSSSDPAWAWPGKSTQVTQTSATDAKPPLRGTPLPLPDWMLHSAGPSEKLSLGEQLSQGPALLPAIELQSAPGWTKPKFRDGFCSLFLERYDPIAVLGCGGFGTVFKARSKSNGMIVAVKMIRKDKVCTSVLRAGRFTNSHPTERS